MKKMFNEIIEYDDYAEIILYNKEYKEKGRTIIDKDLIDKIKNIRWFLSKRGYAECKRKDFRCKLHQFILGKKIGKEIDHINRNKLDNRKCNLRFVSSRENSLNTGLRKDNTSGVKGVYWDKKRKKWLVCVGYLGKQINLGRFNKKEDAIKVRKKAEIKYKLINLT